MAIWRAMVQLSGGAEAHPPTLGRLRCECLPSKQSHRSGITRSPCCLRRMPASGPGGESRPHSLTPQSQGKGPRTFSQGRVFPARGYRGHFRMFLSPSPVRVLFSFFTLKNSVFSCRTGWTPPRKSRSRSGVSDLRWLEMRWEGGQGLQARGPSVLPPHTLGSAFRPVSSFVPRGNLREGRTLFYR